MRDQPFALFGAAGVVGVQAAGLCVASVLAAIDTASGQSYQRSSGIALTVIGFCAVAAVAWVAAGLAQARRWSWTPAILIQVFSLIVGIYLLQGHRYSWGVPAVLLAAVAAVLLLLPRTMDALGRKPPPAEDRPPRPAARNTAARNTAARNTGPAPGSTRPSRPRSGRP